MRESSVALTRLRLLRLFFWSSSSWPWIDFYNFPWPKSLRTPSFLRGLGGRRESARNAWRKSGSEHQRCVLTRKSAFVDQRWVLTKLNTTMGPCYKKGFWRLTVRPHKMWFWILMMRLSVSMKKVDFWPKHDGRTFSIYYLTDAL